MRDEQYKSDREEQHSSARHALTSGDPAADHTCQHNIDAWAEHWSILMLESDSPPCVVASHLRVPCRMHEFYHAVAPGGIHV